MPEDQLTRMSAFEIAEQTRRGSLSPREVVEHFLARITALDGHLHSFSVVDTERALDQARIAERLVTDGAELGPLHGVPISVKEHIGVRGLHTSGIGGKGGKLAEDDYIGIERLRAAGAIILGTNSMIGSGGGVRYADGAMLGTFDWETEARNPWDLRRSPGSSSTGGAAAVAARLIPVAIGSDGGGSNRVPAAFTATVGVLPSRGRVPHMDGDDPAVQLTTMIGPITANVRDAALILGVMAGPDGRDFACIEDPPENYVAACKAGVAGDRFWWTDDFGFAPVERDPQAATVIDALRSSALRFESLSAKVEMTDVVWENPWDPFEVTGKVHECWPGTIKQQKLEPPTPTEYRAAIEVRARNVEKFRSLLGRGDLLLSPTARFLPPEFDPAWVSGPPTEWFDNTAMFNWIGWPAISVPGGFVNGLPVGLQIAGRPGSEASLFAAAAAFEKLSPDCQRAPDCHPDGQSRN
jgi:aspartyl-tRNA(Asn)/glutamyl-tRNA(Gln) amidotransferase subunit A